jgi:hypothetical protein
MDQDREAICYTGAAVQKEKIPLAKPQAQSGQTGLSVAQSFTVDGHKNGSKIDKTS